MSKKLTSISTAAAAAVIPANNNAVAQAALGIGISKINNTLEIDTDTMIDLLKKYITIEYKKNTDTTHNSILDALANYVWTILKSDSDLVKTDLEQLINIKTLKTYMDNLYYNRSYTKSVRSLYITDKEITLTGPPPQTGKIIIDGKLARDFFESMGIDAQCKATANADPTIKKTRNVCYICQQELKHDKDMISKPQCEHILPIVNAILYTGLIQTHGGRGKAAKYVYNPIEQQLLRLEYRWSHACCNLIKNDDNWVTVDDNNIYIPDRDSIRKSLNKIYDSANTEARGPSKYTPKGTKGAINVPAKEKHCMQIKKQYISIKQGKGIAINDDENIENIAINYIMPNTAVINAQIRYIHRQLSKIKTDLLLPSDIKTYVPPSSDEVYRALKFYKYITVARTFSKIEKTKIISVKIGNKKDNKNDENDENQTGGGEDNDLLQIDDDSAFKNIFLENLITIILEIRNHPASSRVHPLQYYSISYEEYIEMMFINVPKNIKMNNFVTFKESIYKMYSTSTEEIRNLNYSIYNKLNELHNRLIKYIRDNIHIQNAYIELNNNNAYRSVRINMITLCNILTDLLDIICVNNDYIIDIYTYVSRIKYILNPFIPENVKRVDAETKKRAKNIANAEARKEAEAARKVDQWQKEEAARKEAEAQKREKYRKAVANGTASRNYYKWQEQLKKQIPVKPVNIVPQPSSWYPSISGLFSFKPEPSTPVPVSIKPVPESVKPVNIVPQPSSWYPSISGLFSFKPKEIPSKPVPVPLSIKPVPSKPVPVSIKPVPIKPVPVSIKPVPVSIKPVPAASNVNDLSNIFGKFGIIPHDECSICYEHLRDEPTVELPCHHIFHEKCIKQLLANNPNATCPLCRGSIPEYLRPIQITPVNKPAQSDSSIPKPKTSWWGGYTYKKNNRNKSKRHKSNRHISKYHKKHTYKNPKKRRTHKKSK